MNNQSDPFKQLRKEYYLGGLDEGNAPQNPFDLFKIWFEGAIAAELPEPNGMTVVSVGADGRPSARILLLKSYDERGFVFFSNYLSRKGKELSENPHATLNFWWASLEQQVRIDGWVERTSSEESDTYYRSRPRGSRLGAWVSPQSEVIESRDVLAERQKEVEARFEGVEDVPRPPHWGGFRLVPDQIEFWHGRPNRLHDRLRYSLEKEGGWTLERLAP